jgi:hypothetical protein
MKRNRRTRVLNKPRGHIYGATWLGIPAALIRARVVRVVVGDIVDKNYWAREFVGQERSAIEMRVTLPPDGLEIFYLDNEDGKTVDKLTTGGGDPLQQFRQLNVTALVPDETIKLMYGFTNKG